MKILRLRSHFGTKAMLNVSRKLAVNVWEVHDYINKVVREVLIAGLHGLDNSLLTPQALRRILGTFCLVQCLNL